MDVMKEPKKLKQITGSLIGTAIGDALGLSYEGVSKKRVKKIFPNLDKYHFFLNKGMISDDTEHACITAQAIISSGGNSEEFGVRMSQKLRVWLLGLPAGIGLATLKAILKMWIGFPFDKSGIYSAGNGPAMRAPIIGVCFGDNPELLKEFIKVSTRITHTDPKAEYASLAIALAAYLASLEETIIPEIYLAKLKDLLPQDAIEFIALVEKVITSINKKESTEIFAESLGLEKGITGYIYHTVPVVLHCWLTNQNDYNKGIKEIIACGGDTDTTAAILGGIIGVRVGEDGIDKSLRANFFEYPRSLKWLRELGLKLAKSLDSENFESQKELEISMIAIFIRNLFFMLIVLLHGFRRLLPPY